LKKRLQWLLPLGLLLISSLFFIGGPDASSPLVFFYLWDLGHVVFFFSLVLCIHLIRPLAFWQDWLLILVAVLLLGIAIELVQKHIGRNASWDDVLYNLYGVFLGLGLSGGSISNKFLLTAIRCLSVALLVPALWMTSYVAYSDLRMRGQFPVINNFENDYELRQVVRIGRSVREQSPAFATNGNYSLAVNLGTEKYSGIKWIGRYGGWDNYSRFAIDIYNAGDSPFDLVIKIADLQHDSGENLITDRFNRSVTLAPGHNSIHINLGEIHAAPAGRAMQMNKINCLEIFTVSLDAPRVIYVDYVRLE
jgi:VanZ family protein